MLNDIPDRLKDVLLDVIRCKVIEENKDILKEVNSLKQKITDLEIELEQSYNDNDSVKDELKSLQQDFKDNSTEIAGVVKWALSQGATVLSAVGLVSDEAMSIIHQEDLKTISVEKCRNPRTGLLPWEVTQHNIHLVKRGENLF